MFSEVTEADKKKATKTVKSSGKIVFFGECDTDRDGNITSDMPAWYLRSHITELEESINKKEIDLKRGTVEADQVPLMKSRIESEKKKLKQIMDSRPNLEGKNKDRVAGAYKSIAEQIRDSMPTRKETKNGLVNPYDELNRLKEKHIKVDPEIAAACGCRPVHGKITGDEAAKCYQIMGRALGENTNVERLRRDDKVPAYKTIDDLTEAILSRGKIK